LWGVKTPTAYECARTSAKRKTAQSDRKTKGL